MLGFESLPAGDTRWLYGEHLDLVVFVMQLVLLFTVVIGIIRMRHRAWLYSLAAALFCGAYMTVNSQQSYLGVIMLMLIIPASF